MYFAIMKLSFESSPDAAHDHREVNALIQKLRSRFKICAMPYTDPEDEELTSLVISSLGRTENGLNQQLDSVCELCESSGFGRIESDVTLIEHIDAIEDEENDLYADDD